MSDVNLGRLYVTMEGRDVGLTDLLARTRSSMQGTGKSALSLGGDLKSLISAFGAPVTALGAVIGTLHEVKKGFELSATLDEQRRTLGSLLGDVQRGNTVFKDAAEFGRRYGFTQKEMGEAVQAATQIIKSSVAPTEQILGTLSRLASINPEQGIQGASRALAELQSGQINSVVTRFNLSRDAANRMKKEIEGGADAVQVLDAELAKMGVTQDSLAQRTQGAAGTQRSYAQAVEDLDLALGKFAAGPGVKALELAAAELKVITNLLNGQGANPENKAQAEDISGKLTRDATSYEDYARRRVAAQDQINAALDQEFQGDPAGSFVAKQMAALPQLTAGQYAYAKSLIDTGVAADEATRRAQTMGELDQLLGTQINGTTGTIRADMEARRGAMLAAAEGSEENTQRVIDANAAYIMGDMTIAQYDQILGQSVLTNQQHAAAVSEDNVMLAQAAVAHQEVGNAALDAMQKTIDDKLATEQLNQQQQVMADLANGVVNGHYSVAQAAQQVSAQFGIEFGQAEALIQKWAILQSYSPANVAKRNQGATDFRQMENFGETSAVTNARIKAEKDAQAARDRQLQATGSHNQKMDVLQRQYNDAVRQYGKDSAEAIDAQTVISQENQAGSVRKGGAAKVGAAQKFNNQLLGIQDKYQDDTEAKERAHQRKLTDIERDAQEKRSQQERRNEVSKRSSRADFYDSLYGQDFDTSAFQSQYEQAYQRSQEIAQAGNRKLSEDYLAMRQRQIQADEEYARQAKEVQDDEDLSKGEKAQRLANIEERKRLRAEANAEEEKQLIEHGDELNNEQARQLADENQRYQDAVDEAANKYDDLADRRIASNARANAAIASTPPAELAQARKTGQATGDTATSTNTTNVPKASEVLAVRDDSVVGAIQSQTGELKDALNDVRRAVESVERSVNNRNAII